MAKTINEQIVELQSENDRLKKLQKLFEKAVKDEFGVRQLNNTQKARKFKRF